jgi:hypothetical protein
MITIDSKSRFRDTFLFRRLLFAVLSGGTMSQSTRKAVVHGLAKAACTAEPAHAETPPPAVFNFTNITTINIIYGKPPETPSNME